MEHQSQWGRTPWGIPETWPKDGQGTPEKPALLAGNLPEGPIADMTRNMLGAYGIPSVELRESDGMFARVLFGVSSYGVGLFVPASRLEEARALMDSPADPGECSNADTPL